VESIYFAVQCNLSRAIGDAYVAIKATLPAECSGFNRGHSRLRLLAEQLSKFGVNYFAATALDSGKFAFCRAIRMMAVTNSATIARPTNQTKRGS
jgi:hypothetical protein